MTYEHLPEVSAQDQEFLIEMGRIRERLDREIAIGVRIRKQTRLLFGVLVAVAIYVAATISIDQLAG